MVARCIFPPQISTNGLISFDISIPFFFNFPFPGFLANFYVIAPFWDDINTNNGGTISYEIHQGDSSAMQTVSAYVSAQTGEDFTGYWMMVVLWSEVPPFFATTSDVSCVAGEPTVRPTPAGLRGHSRRHCGPANSCAVLHSR